LTSQLQETVAAQQPLAAQAGALPPSAAEIEAESFILAARHHLRRLVENLAGGRSLEFVRLALADFARETAEDPLYGRYLGALRQFIDRSIHDAAYVDSPDYPATATQMLEGAHMIARRHAGPTERLLHELDTLDDAIRNDEVTHALGTTSAQLAQDLFYTSEGRMAFKPELIDDLRYAAPCERARFSVSFSVLVPVCVVTGAAYAHCILLRPVRGPVWCRQILVPIITDQLRYVAVPKVRGTVPVRGCAVDVGGADGGVVCGQITVSEPEMDFEVDNIIFRAKDVLPSSVHLESRAVLDVPTGAPTADPAAAKTESYWDTALLVRMYVGVCLLVCVCVCVCMSMPVPVSVPFSCG
jgi:hypothetical protein